MKKQKTLSVKIPAGVDEGDRIRLSGEGEAGVNGGPPGDLYVADAPQAARRLPARRRRPALRDADQLHDRGARRRDRDPDARRLSASIKRAGRNADAARCSACAARASRACAARRRATSSATSSSRRRCSLTERQSELLREFEAISNEGQRAPQPARQVLDGQGEGVLRRLKIGVRAQFPATRS